MKEVFSGTGAATLQTIATVILAVTFVAICVWVWLRPRQEIDQQSRIPLDDDPRRADEEAPPMSEQPQDILTDHAYDGIQEFDNPTPGWWNMLFAASVVFSLVYWLYFHMTMPGRTIIDEYEVAVAENLRQQFAEIGELQGDEQTMLTYMQPDKADWRKVGEIVFAANCQTCHGSDGSGLSCPNLTDDYYKNVKKVSDIPNVIANGAANGAMPSWKNRLHPNEIVLVAAYVANMRGENLKSQRPPEGELAPPWPAYTPPAESAGEQAVSEDKGS